MVKEAGIASPFVDALLGLLEEVFALCVGDKYFEASSRLVWMWKEWEKETSLRIRVLHVWDEWPEVRASFKDLESKEVTSNNVSV